MIFDERRVGGGTLLTTDYLTLLSCFMHRLPIHHIAYVELENEKLRVEAGIIGENYYVDLLSNHGYSVLNDLYITQQQMDLVILSPHAIFVLEVKNIRGKVHFRNAPRQLIRELENGEVAIFTSPFVQLDNSVRILKDQLKKHHYPLPVFGAVCFPFHNCIVTGDTSDFPIFVGRDILNYIVRVSSGEPILNSQQVNEVKKVLLQANVPLKRKLLAEKYKIDRASLKNGCRCEKCNYVGMERAHAMWVCPKCAYRSRDAHVQALFEYANIISEEITLRETMNFLILENRFIAKRLLESAGAKRIGNTRNTKYLLTRF